MQHLIKRHVLNGEFEQIRQLMSETDFMEFEEAYISSAHEVESMMFYTCILDLIRNEEISESVSYTHLRAHETKANLVCRLLLEKKK